MKQIRFLIYIFYFLVFCVLLFGIKILPVFADNPYVNIESCVLSLSGDELVVSGTLVGAKAITACQQPCGFPTPGLCCQIKSAVDVSDTKKEIDLTNFGIIPPADLILIQSGGGGACWSSVCDGPAFIWRFLTIMDISGIGPGNHTTKISAYSNGIWASDTCDFAKSLAPTATNLTVNASDWCAASPAYYLSWTYSDPDGDQQSRFDLQIDDSGILFPSPEINRTFPGLSNPSPTTNNQAVNVLTLPQADYLTYGTRYYWRVKVYDATGLDSDWVYPVPQYFDTPSHKLPSCDFTWLPTSPNVGESTDFTDQSTCYDALGDSIPCTSWSWTFTDGTPLTSILQNPTGIKFALPGTKDVTFTVTDSFGSQCSVTMQVNVNLIPREWKEIKPW